MGDADMPDQSPWRTRSQGIRSQSQVPQETLRKGDLCAAVFLGRKWRKQGWVEMTGKLNWDAVPMGPRGALKPRWLFRGVQSWADRAGPLYPTLNSDWMEAVLGEKLPWERQLPSAKDNSRRRSAGNTPGSWGWVPQFWRGDPSGTWQHALRGHSLWSLPLKPFLDSKWLLYYLRMDLPRAWPCHIHRLVS